MSITESHHITCHGSRCGSRILILVDDGELAALTLEEAPLMQEAVLFEVVYAVLLSLSSLLLLLIAVIPCVLDF